MSQNVPLSEKLPANQHRAIVALLSSDSLKEAADKAGVDRRTLSRWLKNEAFSAAYRSARRQVMEHAVERAQSKCNTALDTLCDVCEGKLNPPASRVAAAKAIFEIAKQGALDDAWAELRNV